MTGLLSLEDAQARLLALAPLMPAETIPTEQALGRYMCENIHAVRTQPPADLSAMDGYAINGPGPWQRVGESRAGAPFGGTLILGQCVRISTGAHVPAGADRVLLQENAVVAGDHISAAELPPPQRHIRPRGFDFGRGDLLLTSGTRLNPASIALTIAAGRSTIEVVRLPRIAILDTGDELAVNPAECDSHQIPASNGAMLAAMFASLGFDALRIGPIRDDRTALAAAFHEADSADLLITSGGASVGEHDMVQSALQDWGAQIAFWKVAIKPGKPLIVATRGAQLVIGLPGNPVSCFVTAFLFALPALRAAMGAKTPLPSSQSMRAGEALPPVGKRREFLRAVSQGNEVRLAGSQDSSALRSLVEADCLIDRPAGSPALAAGEPVTVFPLHIS
jgi:molybdopterin molybdotransferase